ncbi:ATP-dependent DNA ligase [Streptomyces sp. ME02-6987-2C]|uniref:ATP-dependent DNA ligase n=1 Tax=unclassified Streptomyces TaxID=2593676 RepID=UPI0029A9BB16|nr:MULTISPECIES: ATP-dependent DNA ligase [unclassified Streptomyces]MDX3370683.1 ATP-dependent DNA ligase [Streptomyces sp. ME02-6987-2C]MDX3425764.1 ATP-dependent DNA ligase [Streptomyces sp. ME02-6985-2c]
MTWTLPEPMLSTPVDSPDLPAGAAAEPKWDGYRAQIARYADGRVLLRSRQGTDMTAAFPEIADAALAQLPADTGLDGELVVWEGERLAFERLQQRMARRRGAGALAAARTWPAHLVVFDVLRLEGADLTLWPYARRRTALETLFADTPLTAPFTLCPSTTVPATARDWLTWTSAGLEGLCFKRLSDPYRPGARQGWSKYKVRATADAIVGAVTGPVTAPRTLMLGRHDRTGGLRYLGRTTTLVRAPSASFAEVLVPAVGGHPWEGRTFTAGWGSRDVLDVVLVDPQLVVEVAVDVARDRAGLWRHPVRLHRPRFDLSPDAVPLFGA